MLGGCGALPGWNHAAGCSSVRLVTRGWLLRTNQWRCKGVDASHKKSGLFQKHGHIPPKWMGSFLQPFNNSWVFWSLHVNLSEILDPGGYVGLNKFSCLARNEIILKHKKKGDSPWFNHFFLLIQVDGSGLVIHPHQPKTISRWITWHPEQQHFGNKRQFANSPEVPWGSNRSTWTNVPVFGWYKTPRIKITRNTKVDMYNSNIAEPIGNKKTMWQCILILESMEVHVHLMDVWSTRKIICIGDMKFQYCVKWANEGRYMNSIYQCIQVWIKNGCICGWKQKSFSWLEIGHISKPNYINAGASHTTIARYPSEQWMTFCDNHCCPNPEVGT